MKQKITLLLLAVICFSKVSAQLILSQGFNNPASIFTGTSTTNIWIKTNNSSPLGSTSWFSGSPGVFPAYSGADSTFIAANYNSTTGSNGVISDWLITPTVTLANGGVIQFATRTNTTNQTVSPDRLELYASPGNTAASVGAASSSLGTFTMLLTSVNPSLTATGYPTSWTVYTATLSGLTGSVAGRFGFRYDVTSAGPTGTNSSYIGIDEVSYSLPCANPTLAISTSTTGVCSGDGVTIVSSGANTYTWSSGQNTSSITVFPTANTVYTLTASSIPNCNSSATLAITATLTPNLSVPDVTTCPNTAATLAASGATSYSWSTGATTSSIVAVTQTTNLTYSVTGFNGDCQQTVPVSVALGASLSIGASASQYSICSGHSTTLSAVGASTYSWNQGPATTTNNPVRVVTPTVTTKYILIASDSSRTCFGKDSLTIAVSPSPTLNVVGSPSLNANSVAICANTPLTLIASGASSYTWSGGSNFTSTLTATTPTANGNVSYVVAGTATNGCVSTATVSAIVSVCTGIESIQANAPASFFPNPFSNELKISNISGTVEIFDALGQMVLKQAVNGQETLLTEGFIKGIYILKAYTGENNLITTVKLIKN